MAEKENQIVKKEKALPAKKDTSKKLPVAKKNEKASKAAVEEMVIDVPAIEDPSMKADAKSKNKKKQVRYIFRDAEKGWYEKERDNARITKFYATQKEAVEAAKEHIRNSGLPGSVIIQSKAGKIRANTKVTTKKL